jgi:SP family arabinose:H+ symporter-like MFS transporter
MAGCVATLFLTGVFFYCHVTSGIGLVVVVSTFLAFFAFSLGPISWIIISEIFPTDIRGRAMSLSTVVLWIGCAAVSQTFPWLLENLSPAGTFWLYAALTLLSWVAVWRLIPETKGRSLEQIERSWRGKLGV